MRENAFLQIMTFVAAQELSEKSASHQSDRRGFFNDPKLNAFVQCGAYFDEVILPPVENVFGGPLIINWERRISGEKTCHMLSQPVF